MSLFQELFFKLVSAVFPKFQFFWSILIFINQDGHQMIIKKYYRRILLFIVINLNFMLNLLKLVLFHLFVFENYLFN